MSGPANHDASTPRRTGDASAHELRAQLEAQGFSRAEAEQALHDIGVQPPSTAPVPPRPDLAGRPPAGTLAYGIGFLGYLPLPIISNVIAGLAMAAVYPSQRRLSPLAAENARRAANWGLTVVAVTVLVLALVLAQVLLLASDDPEQDVWMLWPFVGIPVLGVAHLVVLIVGLVHTSRGTVFRNPLAIPFLRGGRLDRA